MGSLCYGHVGGFLGEALLKFFLKEELIKRNEDDYFITDKGWDELELIGIDIDSLRSIKSKIVKVCVESNYGIIYEHIGSYLGAFLFDKMCELGWVEKKDDKHFEITEKGLIGLTSFGVEIKPLAYR